MKPVTLRDFALALLVNGTFAVLTLVAIVTALVVFVRLLTTS